MLSETGSCGCRTVAGNGYPCWHFNS
ncbi:SWIM zinc finger family protein [Paenibacillus sp. GCM10027628]